MSWARRRLELLKRFLDVTGIDARRFEYTWVSASEGPRWQQVVETFTKRIHDLGPMPLLDTPMTDADFELLAKTVQDEPRRAG